MKKKLLSILLTLCMLLTLLPTVALAADTTGTFGAFTVTYDDSSTVPTYDSSTLTLGEGNYTIAQTAGMTTATTDKIVVASGVAANITLNGVNIDVSSIRDACAFDLTGATVNLTLSSTNTLKSGNNKAGLQVPTGATLTINGIGSLSVFGGGSDGGAGIGGAGYYSAGTIIINSGVVTAKATSFGAGIGGGESAGGGTVTINGGMVTASGSRGGAGIGGGSGSASRTCGSGGEVTICGGTVIANSGGLNSAGIGGGGKDYDYIPPVTGTVTITGGSVKASSIPAQPKNSSAQNVYLSTFTVPNDTSGGVDVSGMTFTSGGTAYTYSMTDTKSILDGSNGKVYVYLPGDSTGTSATAIYGGNTYTATVKDDNTATFQAPSFSLTKNTTTNGSYTVKVGGSEVTSAKYGDTVTITPAASSGYEVDTISVYKTGDTNTTVAVSSNAFTMPAYDVTVSVTFKASSYNVSKTTTTNGSYTVKVGGSEVTSAKSGDTVTITPTASSGYEVDTISVYKTGDTSTTLTVSSNAFTMPAYDITVSVTFKAVSTPPAGGGGGGGGVTPTSPDAPVIVDGKTESIGKSETTTDETRVTVDSDKLTEKINTAQTGGSVEVPVSDGKTVSTAEIVVKNVEDMAKKDMTLEVKSGNVSYQLPTTAIDTTAAMEALGASDASKVPLSVTITKLDESTVKVVNGELVVPPVEFTVTVTYSGKTVEISSFSKYVQRSIEISKEQASQITTAVVKNEDGTLRHVPTYVYEQDGKWFADINSRTNSTYALIQNEVTFADAKGKWYENIVTEMASRKIIAGRSASVFGGGASITRAEFVAILVRALGLSADGISSFSDVPTTAWYTGAVATAVQYGLASGTGENRFSPNAAITRQEAMLMLKRAAALTEFSGTSGALDGFTDVDAVSSWAKDAAKWNVGSGLIKGSDGKLNPTAKITRAESATIILRLLQKAGLVDVRS